MLEKAIVLNGTDDVAEEILALIGDARFVLIGEASYGTHEFYKYRADITKRLIAEKDFFAVVIEPLNENVHFTREDAPETFPKGV